MSMRMREVVLEVLGNIFVVLTESANVIGWFCRIVEFRSSSDAARAIRDLH